MIAVEHKFSICCGDELEFEFKKLSTEENVTIWNFDLSSTLEEVSRYV